MRCREKFIEGLFTYGVKLRTLLKEEKPILRPTRESLDEGIVMVRDKGNGCLHPYAFPMQEVAKSAEDEKDLRRRNLLNKKTQTYPTRQYY